MDTKSLSNANLILAYSEIISELKERNVIRTKNLLGDLAEYLVIEHFTTTPTLPNLQPAPPGTKNVDAMSRKGERYSIKATSGKLTGSFWGLNNPDSNTPDIQKFEFLIIARFDNNFKLVQLLQLSWNQFVRFKSWNKTMRCWKISLTKELIRDSEVLLDFTK
jgi:hypothetical protein